MSLNWSVLNSIKINKIRECPQLISIVFLLYITAQNELRVLVMDGWSFRIDMHSNKLWFIRNSENCLYCFDKFKDLISLKKKVYNDIIE